MRGTSSAVFACGNGNDSDNDLEGDEHDGKVWDGTFSTRDVLKHFQKQSHRGGGGHDNEHSSEGRLAMVSDRPSEAG